MLVYLANILSRFSRVLFTAMPNEDEILQRIYEEMEFSPTPARASKWARDLESLEPYFLYCDGRTPMQIRKLVEAKGAVYDLIAAFESGSELPYVAHYRLPLMALRRDIERQRFLGF